MAEVVTPPAADELSAAAGAVLAGGGAGEEPLRALEWSPRPDRHDSEWLAATLALFRAQGRVLAATPALGAMGAQALGASAGPDDLSTVLAVSSSAADGGRRAVVPAHPVAPWRLVVDLGDQGLAIVAGEDLVTATGAEPYDPAVAAVLWCGPQAMRPLPSSVGTADARREAQVLLQLAASAEILGACDALMALASGYAGQRRQFGRLIGSFQAVRHLLAQAEAERRSLEAGVGHLFKPRPRGQLVGEDGLEAALLKALAGRTGERVARAALQVLGGSGFTWESDLHRYARRILTLDALGGTREQLAEAIGRQVRGAAVPRPAAF